MKKSLQISTWNLCNGLLYKMPYVKELLKEYKLDILFLQETKLPYDVNLKLIQVDDYTIKIARSTSTARTVVYIHTTVKYERVEENVNTNVILINLNEDYQLKQLCGIYRQFKLNPGENHLTNFKKQ